MSVGPQSGMPPEPSRGWAWFGAVVSALYILNPTWGVFEIIPDNFPIIGNLDDFGASLLFVQCFRILRRKKQA